MSQFIFGPLCIYKAIHFSSSNYWNASLCHFPAEKIQQREDWVVESNQYTSSSAMAERPCEALICFRLTSSVIGKITKLHFWATMWGIRGNTSALYENFNAKKLCSRVSSRECQFYSWNSKLAFLSHPLWKRVRGNVCDSSLASWKVLSRLPIGYNCIFF